jgi:hypothetical protein
LVFEEVGPGQRFLGGIQVGDFWINFAMNRRKPIGRIKASTSMRGWRRWIH